MEHMHVGHILSRSELALLTSSFDVHDIADETGDPIRPALPDAVPHHAFQLLPEQLHGKQS